jgi:hypothetical protein
MDLGRDNNDGMPTEYGGRTPSEGDSLGTVFGCVMITALMFGGLVVLPLKKQAETDDRGVAKIVSITSRMSGNYNVVFDNGDAGCVNTSDSELLDTANRAMVDGARVSYHQEGGAKNPHFSELNGSTCLVRITELKPIE